MGSGNLRVRSGPGEDPVVVPLKMVPSMAVEPAQPQVLASRVVHFTLDAECTIQAVNDLVATVLGYDAASLMGQSVLSVVAPEELRSLQVELSGVLQRDGAIACGDFTFIRQDGSRLLLQVTTQALHGDLGPILLLSCQNVCAQTPPLDGDLIAVQRLNAELERQVQKRTAELQLSFEFEATLKRISDRVRDTLDEAHIMHTVVRELAIALGVTHCNAALYDLERRTSTVRYEYTTSQVPFHGRILLMDNFPEGYNQLLQGQYFQFCSLTPNLDRGYVVMLACPILDDQGVLGDLWMVHHRYYAFTDQDIRLVQQVANQCAIALRQAQLYQKAQAQVQALEHLHRLKDDFLSAVSHELRTPMAAIKMAIEMLDITMRRAGLLDDPASPAVRYLKILSDECQRETQLIVDLLNLSRLEAGGEPLHLTQIRLENWLPRFVEPFCERALRHKQRLQVEIAPTLPVLATDLSSLERLLGELLHNACKYTPAGETITLSVTMEERSPEKGSTIPASVFKLDICNSGVQIPADELLRVFDKFYRIPNNDPWKHGGTGLGLALVKKLVETLSGSITVTSESGWTCFALELPVIPHCPITKPAG